jgi:hypothetical protein
MKVDVVCEGMFLAFSFASSLSGAAKKLELAKVDTPSGA